MNDDGPPRITAELEFGARTSLLWWTGAALLGASVLAATSAAGLYASARVKR
jgi:hypothetical protein